MISYDFLAVTVIRSTCTPEKKNKMFSVICLILNILYIYTNDLYKLMICKFVI